jgi:hypothetical protein
MRHMIVATIAGLAVWSSVGVNFASAQFGVLGQPPFRPRPTVSPFVNLGSGGGAMSYYGIIRPQTDQARSIMNLQSAVTNLNPTGSLVGQVDPSKDGQPILLQTGHSVTYFNYSHYYPLTPTGVGSTSVGSFGYTPSLGGFSTLGTYGGGFLNTPTVFFGSSMNSIRR